MRRLAAALTLIDGERLNEAAAPTPRDWDSSERRSLMPSRGSRALPPRTQSRCHKSRRGQNEPDPKKRRLHAASFAGETATMGAAATFSVKDAEKSLAIQWRCVPRPTGPCG